jgi:hypothetical protein
MIIIIIIIIIMIIIIIIMIIKNVTNYRRNSNDEEIKMTRRERDTKIEREKTKIESPHLAGANFVCVFFWFREWFISNRRGGSEGGGGYN